jgi:hypothetical protein
MPDKVTAAKIELRSDMTRALAASLARLGSAAIPHAEKIAMREKILAERRASHTNYPLSADKPR